MPIGKIQVFHCLRIKTNVVTKLVKNKKIQSVLCFKTFSKDAKEFTKLKKVNIH